MRFIEKNNDGGGFIMNKKSLQTAAITMGLTICALPLTACNTRTNNYMNPRRTGIVQRQNVTQYNTPLGLPVRTGTIIGNNVINNPINNASPLPTRVVPYSNSMSDKALAMKYQVKSIPEVSDANVVIVGNTALVACRPRNASVNTNALKTAVSQKCKSSDPTITNVVVSETEDMMTRVNQLYNNLTTRPMSEISQDFNNLVGKIMTTAK
jgi:spore cortex protein